jgi:hypothetical protein
MNDRQLDKILSSSALRQTQLILDSMPTDQGAQDILPSEGFEDRINDLIKNHNKNRNLQSMRRRIGIIAASILVVFTITFGMFTTVSASRDNIMHFFARYFAYNSGRAEIWNTQFNAQISDSVHNVYLPTWVPNGFKATESQQGKNVTYITYSCSEKSIRFSQSSILTHQYNDDEMKQMSILTVNNQKYYYGEKQSGNSVIRKIIWNSNKSSFAIIASVPKDEVFKIAQSLKYKEG